MKLWQFLSVILILSISPLEISGQNNSGIVSGSVFNSGQEPLVGVSVFGLALIVSHRRTGAEIVVGQVDGGGGDLRAVDGELAGVEDMQAAVLQRSLNLGDLLGGAVGNLGAKVGDGDSAILIALAPVLRDVAGLRTLEQLLVVDLPDVGRGGQGSGGGGVEHVDVVADEKWINWG